MKSSHTPLPRVITGEISCHLSPLVTSLFVLLFCFMHTIKPNRPKLIYSLQRMVSFRSSLLPCFLATTSYAFAIKPHAQSPAFTHRSNTPSSTSSIPMMSGGSTATLDLKVSLFSRRCFSLRLLGILLRLISVGSCCNLRWCSCRWCRQGLCFMGEDF